MAVLRILSYTNFLIAAAAGLLCAGWSRSSGFSTYQLLGWFAFFSTLFLYNGHRLYKAVYYDYDTDVLRWARKNKVLITLLMFIGVCCAVAVLIALKPQVSSLIFLLLLSLLGLFYVLPFPRKAWREYALLKAPMIAVVWTGLLICFPMFVGGIALKGSVGTLIAFLVYFLAITIPFDIRDVMIDERSQKSLPMLVGIQRSKLIAVVLLGVFSLIIAIINNEMRYNVFFYLNIILTTALILGASPSRKSIYFDSLDATMIVMGISFLLI